MLKMYTECTLQWQVTTVNYAKIMRVDDELIWSKRKILVPELVVKQYFSFQSLQLQ
jgi:hypothetical protein